MFVLVFLASRTASAAGVYRYRRLILVDHTQVSGPTDLANFPVLVSETDAALRTTSNGGKVESASGFDIVFRGADGIALDHEVERYDGVTGNLIAWVRVPSLKTSSNTGLYIYYGNNQISSSQENPNGVWNANYRAVWHLKENPTSGAPQFLDSTANPNNGTASALNAGHQVAGKIDGSLLFDDGSARHVNVPHHASLQLANNMTVSAWVRKLDCAGDVGVIVNKWGPGADKNYWLGKENGTDLVFNVDIGQKVIAPLAPLCDSLWHHVQGVADVTGGRVRLFVDGTERNTAPYDGVSNTGTWVHQIGKSSDVGGQEWNGGIDEVRVVAAALPADWIATEYNNQSSPSTFYIFVQEEDLANLPALTSSSGAFTFTVTAPDRFELVFDTRYGGGIEKFFDLTEDPGRSFDLAGGNLLSGNKTLMKTSVLSGGFWYHPEDNSADTADPDGRWSGSPPKLDVLEATSTRVKVRQEAFYERLCEFPPCSPIVIQGLKAFVDFSVYPPGKVAQRFNRKNYSASAVAVDDQDLPLGVRTECPGAGNSCTDLTAYHDAGAFAGPGPAASKFLLAQREVPGRRTDFLRILHQNWTLANRTEYDQSVAFLVWRDQPTTGSVASNASDIWNSLVYFKPTNFASHADLAVTRRSDDYRGADDPLVSLGTGWTDLAENTGGADLFNESEAAYVFNMDPAAGLVFDIDGAPTVRHSPFFKIRQWRSLQPPTTVLLDGVTLNYGVDFRADVKPVSRAQFADQIRFYSTLENLSGVNFPNVGAGGSVAVGVTYVPARFGAGALLDVASEHVAFGSTNNFNTAQGAISFWYKPSYAHTDGVRHVLWENFGDANHSFLLEKLQVGGGGNNALRLTIKNGPGGANQTIVTVSSANYSWRAGDWVHVRASWDTAAALGNQARIFLNGVEPPHTDPTNPYNSATMVVGTNYIGADSAATSSGLGVFDELYAFNRPDAPAPLARGGFVGDLNEFLGDGASGKNATLPFTVVDSAITRRAEYFYAGADSRFRGLNVALATAGTGVAPVLRWQLWNGVDWTNITLLTDETNHLTRTGTIYWDMDLSGWQTYSPDGGPELYYVRAFLESGSYLTSPIEGLIKTDILLFQYAGDITAAAQTFDFAPPVPTAVELTSLEARGIDGAVALSWRTASELNNLGFHVLRATDVEGPYHQVTSSPIPGLGSSVVGALYQYVDPGLQNGVAYFYKIRDLETSGRTELHGPVSATAAAGASSNPAPPGANPEAAALLTYGSPSRNEFRIKERGPGELVLELLTEGFHAEPLEDGTVRILIPGLEELEEETALSIPVKRASIRAIPGVKVDIASVHSEDLEWIEGLRPSGAAAPGLEASAGGTVRLERTRRRTRSRTNGFSPERIAEIASVGFQGDEKKAVVQLAPLRWDSSSERLLLARRLTVRVAFRGREPDETALEGGRGRRLRPMGRTTTPIVRLATVEPGLYAVPFEDVLPNGRRSLSPRSLRLSRQGETMRFHIEPDPRQFGPGSKLYFLSGGAPENPYGKESIYELSIGLAGETMPLVDRTPSGPETGFYWETLSREEDRFYQAGLVDATDLWLGDLFLAPAAKRYSFTVSELFPASDPSPLRVWLQGTSDFPASPDHHVRLLVNDNFLVERSWDGKKSILVEGKIAPGILREGENVLEMVNVGDTEAPHSMFMLDRFEIHYPRRPVASSGKLEGYWSEAGAAELRGVPSGVVIELGTDGPRWVAGVQETNEGATRFRAESARRYLITSASAVLRPEVRIPRAKRWSRSTNQADYIVIGPRELLDAAEPLLSLRRRQGLTVASIPIEEVFSEFGFGETAPEAIRRFLVHAYHHWREPSPRYVLLVGDATYDFKNRLGTGVENHVPPLMVRTRYLWTASDPLYAAVNGDDDIPDLAIGRLPAATASEMRRMVEKILDFEARESFLTSGVVLVADDRDRAGDFEADAEALAGGILARYLPKRVYLGRLGPAATREAILETFDSGASIVSYIGHGGIHLWADENIFNTADASRLSPQPQQPLLLTMNCLNGYFHFPYFNSLAEELLKAGDRGAIAAFSPSGLSLNEPAQRFHEAFLVELTSGRHARLGDAMLAAQRVYADSGSYPELLSIYHLLGDPALSLR